MDEEGERCSSPKHVVMSMVNTTLHLSLSSPAEEAALREKLHLRCCDIGNSFQSAPHNLLSTTPLSLEQRQMPQTCPERIDFFSLAEMFQFIVTVIVPSPTPLQCVSG